jgi:hypothetical protein
MKSKLLQKIIYGVNKSREVVDGQKENIGDSSLPSRGHENPSNPVNTGFDAEGRKDFPGLLKRNYRPGAESPADNPYCGQHVRCGRGQARDGRHPGRHK